VVKNKLLGYNITHFWPQKHALSYFSLIRTEGPDTFLFL